ncbi:thioredoxin domain-containing protein 3 homolog isoform X2 [Rhopilema esculentum]|uniref:thioredoxin domain-containing protein 3 homolog isoform X2 n=1 Tax=Rhopilema esculentum TaxID=499914 RepID=UPI0031E2A847
MALKRNPEAMKELRVDVKTQEQWEELISKEGLIVVDAYAGWCGPCKAIESTFRRIRNESGDDLLHFAMAETDTIEALEAYRDKSKPTFLFFGGGQLVHVIRGCDAPSLIQSIAHFLREEHRIMSGDAERKVFIDLEIQQQHQKLEEEKQDQEKEETVEEDEEIEMVEVPKEISVVIIKPDALKNGHADEIIQNIEDNGVEILHKEERVLTKEEAAEFYKQHEGSEHFEQLIEFMSSDPVLTLVLSKKGEDPGYGLIPELRDLIGPKDVNQAKEEAPASIRAQYGTDAIMNAVHSCDSSESAARELAFFFPEFNVPKVQEKRKKKRIQRTLALIRPGAYTQRKESILHKITEAGFSIAMEKEMYLTREQAEEFYDQHRESDYFESLITSMTSGPSLALCLAREDAVEAWRNLLGPKDVQQAREEAPESLRAVFSEENATINPLHGPDSVETAEKELRKFFPPQATVGVIKPEAYNEPEQREEILKKIEEAGFKISAQKEVHLTKDLAAQFYKEHEGKEFYDGLTDYMSSGPTLFMILSREDAITGFRALVGPNEPEVAREQAPNSLRALFATDPMKNALHSSSNVDKAVHVIHEFFPEVELNEDGTVKEPSKEEPPEDGAGSTAEETANVEEEHTADDANEAQDQGRADESGLEANEESKIDGKDESEVDAKGESEGETKEGESESVAKGEDENKEAETGEDSTLSDANGENNQEASNESEEPKQVEVNEISTENKAEDGKDEAGKDDTGKEEGGSESETKPSSDEGERNQEAAASEGGEKDNEAENPDANEEKKSDDAKEGAQEESTENTNNDSSNGVGLENKEDENLKKEDGEQPSGE